LERRRLAGTAAASAVGAAAVAMQCAEASFEVRKWRVLNTDAARANMLGRHFVVGYSSFDEVARLADRGLISGVYITSTMWRGRAERRRRCAPRSRRCRRGGMRPACRR